ncbi:MAG: alpha/beta fold hydrolase [Haloechinothrix sp.]
MSTSRRIWGIVGGAGAVATGAVAAALTVTQQRRGRRDPYAEEPFGLLEPDRSSTVAADDGTPLYVEEIDPEDGGVPDVTMVGVHGFALSTPSWHFQRRDLASLTLPRVRQVYYDHRSHGRSGPATAESSTIEHLAGDLHAVLRAVVPEGPIVLVGHSLGGMVIMELARQDPGLFAERVQGVSLIATAAGEVGAKGLPRSLLSRHNPLTRGVGGLADWQPGLVEFVRAAGGQLTRQAVRRLAFGDSDVSPSQLDFALALLNGTPVRDLVNFIDTLGSHNRYAALAGLTHAHVQVIGADADMMTPFSHSERIVAELPGAQLVRAHGAGHMVHFEQPDVVTSHLIDLLQRSCGMDGGRGSRRTPVRDLLRRLVR